MAREARRDFGHAHFYGRQSVTEGMSCGDDDRDLDEDLESLTSCPQLVVKLCRDSCLAILF